MKLKDNSHRKIRTKIKALRPLIHLLGSSACNKTWGKGQIMGIEHPCYTLNGYRQNFITALGIENS